MVQWVVCYIIFITDKRVRVPREPQMLFMSVTFNNNNFYGYLSIVPFFNCDGVIIEEFQIIFTLEIPLL